jgi:hypothetical protein
MATGTAPVLPLWRRLAADLGGPYPEGVTLASGRSEPALRKKKAPKKRPPAQSYLAG